MGWQGLETWLSQCDRRPLCIVSCNVSSSANTGPCQHSASCLNRSCYRVLCIRMIPPKAKRTRLNHAAIPDVGYEIPIIRQRFLYIGQWRWIWLLLCVIISWFIRKIQLDSLTMLSGSRLHHAEMENISHLKQSGRERTQMQIRHLRLKQRVFSRRAPL